MDYSFLVCTRLPCPSPSPRACSNSCPLSWWCSPTISSSAAPFSSCLQFFPAPGSFPVSRLLASVGQSIGGQLFRWNLYFYLEDCVAETEVSLYIYAAHEESTLQRDGCCFGIQGPCDVDSITSLRCFKSLVTRYVFLYLQRTWTAFYFSMIRLELK